ncbi:SMC-Scp complex subunit ScpB [Silvibacterium acidisoli]|uniref:SMC-Scp complex subunit ScpB n=1 Tax=Acidobacteriaceae bacterium ZG23-2 TaxID=2883246 RepID=UPI00406D4797
MSLKAKIEAVIYATEEPVTLIQLATLFAPELVEARESRLAAEKAAQQASEEVNPDAAAELAETLPPEEDGAEPQADPEAAVEAAPADVAAPAETSAEDEKRATRQRERELRDEARIVIDSLIADYDASERGMEIREIAGGFRMATRAEYHDAVRSFVKSLKPPMKLSLQALETLAVIAYKQPITAPEVSDIRGVDSAGVLGSLISRKLVTTAGRKQVIGRPILYKTTKEFLLRFGLKDLNELPSMEEFEKMAGELSDAEQMPLTEITDTQDELDREEISADQHAPVDTDEVEGGSDAAVPEEIPEERASAIDVTEVEDDELDLPAIRVEPEVDPAKLTGDEQAGQLEEKTEEGA